MSGYYHPPLYAVNHMDRPLRGHSRDVSPAQAALTFASHHDRTGDYRLLDTAILHARQDLRERGY
jgi:hypothetical protein